MEKSSVQEYYETLEPKFEKYKGIPCLCEPGLHGEIARIVEEHVPRKALLLDVGCGRGALSLRLVDFGYVVEACDLFDLCECKDRVKFIHTAAEDAIFDDSYDAVLMIELLQAVESPFGVIRRYHDLVKPGGHLIISVPNAESDIARAEFLLRGRTSYFEDHNVRNDGSITPVYGWQLAYILEQLGFEMVRRLDVLPHGSKRRVGATWAALKLLETYRQINGAPPRSNGKISVFVARRPLNGS